MNAKMFSQTFFRCPACRTEIRQRLEDGEDVQCSSCRREFRILLDEGSGKAGLIDVSAKRIPEPLYLPKGSVRAFVTMLMALTSWILVFRGMDVPDYLLGLILTIIGYYFGFRKSAKDADSRIFDAGAKKEDPLFLPAGWIRFFLIVGFVAAAGYLHDKGRLGELKYLEFFVILFALIVGYIFAKISRRIQSTSILIGFNHLKGAAVIGAAVCLAFGLLTGRTGGDPRLPLVLASVVSFYFGSRS